MSDLTSDKVQLQTTMDLLDGALRTLEDLKPQCVDSTMSYEERKAWKFPLGNQAGIEGFC